MGISRKDFPSDFIFGTAAASFQIEGAKYRDGKSESIWDRFCDCPGAISDGSNGDTACDHYYRYPEDFALMRDLGVDSYRLSISWPRIIPGGRGKVNDKGVEFYIHLLDSLIEKKITPIITLYHWDLPQVLEDHGGWAARETAEAFAEYADVCFKAFSSRCSQWITLNEPYCSSYLGYGIGHHAPGLCDKQKMYNAIHNLNLAHGLALKKFRDGGYPGKIGITLNLTLYRPDSSSTEDGLAADRATDFDSRMYLHPLIGKGYPRRHLDAYPEYTLPIQDGDMETISGKIDFLGINYYTEPAAAYAADELEEYTAVTTSLTKTEMGWDVIPEGLLRLLSWVHKECGDLPLIITENGSAWQDKVTEPGNGSRIVIDSERTDYLERHLEICLKAVEEGIPLTGYYVWSFIDNFEWAFGFTRRFGIIYCDFETQERIPKNSYYYYRDFLKS